MSPQRWQSICILIFVGVPTTVALALVLHLLIGYPEKYMIMAGVYVLNLLIAGATSIVKAFYKGDRSSQFTLRSVFLLVGFGSCVFIVLQYGKPWQKIYTFPSQLRQLASSSDGQLVAGYSQNAGDPIHIFDLKYGHRIGLIHWEGNSSKIDFTFTSDGAHLLILGEESSAAVARLYDIKSGQEIRSWSGAFPARLAEEVDHFYLTTENAETTEANISLFEVSTADPIRDVAKTEAVGAPAKDTLSDTGGQLLVQDKSGTLSFWDQEKWFLVKSDGSVWNRRIDERWYGLLTLPAFWGANFFLLCLILPPARKSLIAISNIPQENGEEMQVG